MHISIEKGKTLIIRLLAIGPVIEGKGVRDVWFEVNGEVREPLYDFMFYIPNNEQGSRCSCRRQIRRRRDGIEREGYGGPRIGWRAHVWCRSGSAR